VERDLALCLGDKYDQNRPKVNPPELLNFAASSAFFIEIVALILDLVSR
jgi:hypothetical protein